MILTGLEIEKEVLAGNITISPFDKDQLNPNSYNYRIGSHYKCLEDKKIRMIPQSGLTLSPNRLYLSSTIEIIGSDKYVVSLIGRSSIGRLGLFLQCHSDLGNLGRAHKWTLELSCVQPIRIYPRMIIGQISFWAVSGDINDLYKFGYARFNLPHGSILL